MIQHKVVIDDEYAQYACACGYTPPFRSYRADNDRDLAEINEHIAHMNRQLSELRQHWALHNAETEVEKLRG